MEKNSTLMETELPKLRQMVLENTGRIKRNEKMINKIRMENVQQSQKISEHDKWMEIFIRAQDRFFQRYDERLDESRAVQDQFFQHFDEKLDESRAAQDQFFQHFDERLDRLDQRTESTRIEHENAFRELKELFKESREQIKDTSLEVKRLSRQLTGTTGHIVEGLVGSSAAKIFKKAGFELQDSGKNLKRKLKVENIAMEVDVMLSNKTTAIPIEVKANFTKEDVDRFLHQMELFRKLFVEYSEKEVFAGIAALNYENGVAEYAHEKGLLVVRVSSDDIFTLDPVDKATLHKY